MIRGAPRRLAELNPRWGKYHSLPDREGMLLYADCPCGRGDDCEWGNFLCIAIENPVDGGPPHPGEVQRGKPHWRRTGETFDELTLAPSVHAVGHWHGYIRNGLVTSC